MSFLVLLYPNQSTAPQALIRGRFVPEHALRELQSIAAQFDRLAAFAIDLNRFHPGVEHQRRIYVVAFEFVLQRVLEILFGWLCPKLGVAFSAAIAVAP